MSITFEDSDALVADAGLEVGEFTGEFEMPFEEDDFEALGVNPLTPTPAKPGSEEKVTMLAARYAAGLPLWHNDDCYDHGPRERDLMGQ